MSSHPFLQVHGLTKARLEAALKLITDNPNGDRALAALAEAIRGEIERRSSMDDMLD